MKRIIHVKVSSKKNKLTAALKLKAFYSFNTSKEVVIYNLEDNGRIG